MFDRVLNMPLNYPTTQKTITIMLEAWTLAQKLKSILSHGKCRHWGRIPTNLLMAVLFHVRNINFELFFTGKRTSQSAFTSSKLAMETPRNLCKVNNSDTRTTSLTSFRCFYHYLWTDFIHCTGFLSLTLNK